MGIGSRELNTRKYWRTCTVRSVYRKITYHDKTKTETPEVEVTLMNLLESLVQLLKSRSRQQQGRG